MKLVLLQPDLRALETRHNLDVIGRLVEQATGSLRSEDILLLPEHFIFQDDEKSYTDFVVHLARNAGCTVVGGSHHRRTTEKRINVGAVIKSDGSLLGSYTKLRPYSNEQNHVSPGEGIAEFRIGGRQLLVLICADFWYSDIILKATKVPDLILVPALSVSRKPDAEYSRTLWRHLAVQRAYEFGVFVGISDWSERSWLPKNRTCGVGGLADPTQLDPTMFFQPISSNGISIHTLDFKALEEFRDDRRMRGFFWKPEE